MAEQHKSPDQKRQEKLQNVAEELRKTTGPNGEPVEVSRIGNRLIVRVQRKQKK